MKKSGASVKGYFMRTDDKSTYKFQFNPNTLKTSRGANYNTIQGCGSPYPLYQYTGGEGEKITFTLEIFEDADKCKETINYLEGLMPSKNPTATFSKPPIFYFSFGNSFTEKCILTKLDKSHLLFNKDLATTDLSINIELEVIK